MSLGFTKVSIGLGVQDTSKLNSKVVFRIANSLPIKERQNRITEKVIVPTSPLGGVEIPRVTKESLEALVLFVLPSAKVLLIVRLL